MNMNPTFYRTFKRSCTGWKSFASARKTTYDTHLTYDQAREQCKAFNEARTPSMNCVPARNCKRPGSDIAAGCIVIVAAESR